MKEERRVLHQEKRSLEQIRAQPFDFEVYWIQIWPGKWSSGIIEKTEILTVSQLIR